MKILQINMENGWRGGESQTLYAMEHFRQAGHEVELLARTNGELALRAGARGFKVHTHKEAFYIGIYFLAGRAAKFDIIHCQTANSLTWATLFKGCFKGKLVYTRRTAFPIKKHRENVIIRRWKKTDLFVAISHASMSEALRLGVVDSVMNLPELSQANRNHSQADNKANLIIPIATRPEAFDVERFQRIRETHKLQDKKIIAVVAALTEEKDPFALIEAIHQLHQVRQDYAVLHFGSGQLLAACQARVRALGLDAHYIFMGFQTQVEQLFKGFDAYLLSSRFEGANNGIINAFFNEVAVVSTDCGGPKELIGEDQTRGYLCPVGDSAALAGALSLVLDKGDETQNRCRRAKQYAETNHTVEVMGNQYLAAYAILLAQP